MPEFRFTLLSRCVECLVLLHLNYKSDLCRVAEVRDGQSTDFLDEGLASQFEFVLPLLDQVLNLVRLQLHDASDAKLGRPLTLIEIT